ncbi:hypothetical protein A2960_01785 [Candidatus Gottesmanbacteria bacterium RIFCSPLOWO2_01_FULL_39_12b]|uniref:Putative phage metallopeptidase domain-containing protein n=1 Tax=Candidatus Gottesmanbacteria bacterium RIFCSPLOWO2_01_FULL_39_12b TaxID=1798388 RepID=A0A1F6AQT6_9BACT|nr:MAG: hypothetical protein A2960_01785 [Candidatus Gottesmanbacteria bacterium RIFCSPLOWO2_01_FULL_39_12b]
MEWKNAEDIKKDINEIVNKLNLDYIDCKRVICFRSQGSSSRARARIWNFPRVWQQALKLPPHYIIEVLSQYFDKLSRDDQRRVLIHEILHIPRNFSGSLVPHRGRYARIDERRVESLFKML